MQPRTPDERVPTPSEFNNRKKSEVRRLGSRQAIHSQGRSVDLHASLSRHDRIIEFASLPSVMARLSRSRRHLPSLSAEGQSGRRRPSAARPSAGTKRGLLRHSPAPAGLAGQVERRSDMAGHGKFENLPSFRAQL